MKKKSMMFLILTNMLKNINNLINLNFMTLMSSIMLSLNMINKSNSKWIPLSLIMVFSSGMMISFSYILMLSKETSNQKMKIKMMMLMTMLFMSTTLINNNMKTKQTEMMKTLFSINQSKMIMLTSILMLTMMNFLKTAKKKSALKSSI